MRERRAYGLLLLVVLFWAGNYPLSKLALRELGPLTMTGGRALIAAPLLLAIAWSTAPLTRSLDVADYVAFVVLGLTGLVLNTTLWYAGLARTTALNAGIIGAATPILVALGAALFLRDRLHARAWAGIAVSVLAVAITVLKGSLAVLVTFSVNRGDLIILASQVAWVTYSLYSRAAASPLRPVWIIAGAHVVSAIVLVPLAVAVEGVAAPWAKPVGWAVIVYGVVPVTLGHLWYYEIVRTIGPGRTASFLNLMPFVVLGMSWAILGEPVHAYHVVGAVLVIAGVLLASRR